MGVVFYLLSFLALLDSTIAQIILAARTEMNPYWTGTLGLSEPVKFITA
jgi:hypothetical protein